jgi:SAM-dependent methyltransferase
VKLSVEIAAWWKRTRAAKGRAATLFSLASLLWQFARESTPEQRRRRYGDMEFDWEHRVNTTAATLSARDRLIGLLHSPYQATDPELFKEMISALPIDFKEFTFIDIGSGKGRTLLMAAAFPFFRIVGVELIPALHQAAQENAAQYAPGRGIELLCQDASQFAFPSGRLVVYLFNPLPRISLKQLISNLERSLSTAPRPAWIIYHNPLEQDVVVHSGRFRQVAATDFYSLFLAE